MPAVPTASPATATTTGRPAATTERNISSRMSSAATTPMISPMPFMALPAVLGSSPPSTTWTPASWVGSTAFSSGSASPYRSLWVTGTSYCTVSSAVSPSADIRGAVTPRTCGRAPSRPVRAVSSACASGVSSWTTTWAEVLPDSGRCSRSRSTPFWAGAAGTSQSSWVWPPTAPARPKTATATTSQTANVRHGWVAANRPSRSSMRFMAELLGRGGGRGGGSRLVRRRSRAPLVGHLQSTGAGGGPGSSRAQVALQRPPDA